jgi:hypothetical protein
MNHIDITFDMETCATTANAAVMQVAAVAWNRSAKENPFSVGDGSAVAFDYSGIPDAPPNIISFNEHIDLRTCVVDGFDFDQNTVKWWANQTDKAKKAVCADLAEPMEEVFIRFIEWINQVKRDTNAESVCLWCQGMDFDGAILRNICHKYDLELPIRYQQFRDARTVILETAVAWVTRDKTLVKDGKLLTPEDILKKPCLAYELYKPLPPEYGDKSEAHDAMFDCLQTSWSVWQALKSSVE